MDGREEDRIAAVVMSGLALFCSLISLVIVIAFVLMHQTV